MIILGRHEGGLNTNCLTYSPDGKFLASAKGEVQIWDVRERRHLRSVPIPGNASSVAFAPDGNLIVSGSGDSAVRFLDPQTGETVKEFFYSWCRAQCAHVGPDGTSLVCGGHSHGGDGGKLGRVLRWNLKTGRARLPLSGPEDDIGFTSFSPNGRRLAGGGEKGKAWLWDLRSRKQLATFSTRSKGWRVVAFSPDGRTLAITAGITIELWEPDGQRRRCILRGHKGVVWGITYTPDGRLLSGSGDGTVRLWAMPLGTELECLNWQVGAVNNVAAAPDGLTAAAASPRGDIVVWDLE